MVAALQIVWPLAWSVFEKEGCEAMLGVVREAVLDS